MSPTATLHEDLALAASAAAPPHVAAALAGGDPLRLDLPPVPGLQQATVALRALSALYLAARLEETGVVQLADWLVQERATLRVPATTGAKLEDMARRARDAYPREQRLLLYARLFGIGPSVGAEPSGAGSRFEPLLAALCSALVAHARHDLAERAGAIGQAGLELATAAGGVFGGGVAYAVPRLNAQLRRAIDLIGDPGIGMLVGTRGFWPTLQRLLEPNAPDVRRLVECGRHGQRVLLWLAPAVPALQSPSAPQPEVPADLAASAEAWLAATGVPVRGQGEGSV